MYLEGDCPSVDPFEACLIGTAGARSFRISASRLEEMLSGNLRRTQKKPTPEPRADQAAATDTNIPVSTLIFPSSHVPVLGALGERDAASFPGRLA